MNDMFILCSNNTSWRFDFLFRSRHLSFRTSKDLNRKQLADSSMADGKQILISYVRADAAHHALALKQELSSLGLSVYLVCNFLMYMMCVIGSNMH